MIQFNTPYNRVSDPPEINSGEILTDIVGYITAQERIENMMLAGQRLKDFRAGQFDFEPDEQIDEDVQIDPTRAGNFDLADASMLANHVSKNISLKASQTSPEAQNEPLKVPEGYKLVKEEIPPDLA